MTQLLHRLFVWIVFYFRRSADHADHTPDATADGPPTPAPLAPVEEAPQPSTGTLATETIRVKRERTRRARRPDADLLRLKQSILDQLDDNTKIFGRMKAFFPSEYGLYSQVGASIIPGDADFVDFKDIETLEAQPVSPWFNGARPAFGALVTGNPHDCIPEAGRALHPRLTHFLKVKPQDRLKTMFGRGRAHGTIQPIRPTSDLYLFTLYYDERDWARLFPAKTRDERDMARFYSKAFAIELPVEITEDGTMRPLKIMWDRHVKIGQRPRSRQPMYYSDTRRSVRTWDYPYPKGFTKCLKIAITSEQLILYEAGLALRCYEEASSSMIQVRATKGDICTLINVDVEETPDFFLDREHVIIDGIKKRIFHIVRPHERLLGDNRSTHVHLHFRGLRQFVWNGYEVGISVPGRDHFAIDEFDCAAVDETYAGKGHEMSTIGAWLVANQKSRWGALVGKPGELVPLERFKARNARLDPDNPG